MNKDVYSNSELTELKNRINKEMLRRGSYKWWGPLSQPKVGDDKRSPDSIPHDKTSIPVTDQTYTINNPSVGSIEPTRNITYPKQGENPAGQNPDGQTPTTSAARFDLDEIKNFLVGLSKIRDINLFYGQDEQEFLAFRDLSNVHKFVDEIESDRLNEPTNKPYRVDPNAPDRITVTKDGKTWTEPNPNKKIPYEKIGDKYYMLSGEYDGEEGIPSETNYYDDYGAEPGNGNYHGLNPNVSAKADRTGYDFDNNRNKIPVGRMEGGKPSSRFGMTPRNPQQGESYQGRVAYQGVPSSCNNACSGLCYLTCDNQCSESCSTTCFGRCGNNCTATCGNVCTGCSSLCYTSCQSKCENNAGMACVKAGATTLSITARGGKDGTPAYNEMKVGAPYACTQCSFSCQFYPNKKTTCWDNGCMGMCFTSCMHSCSTSCFGGCVDNPSENKGDFKTGIGRGCSSGCTVNCVGICRGTCVGSCSSGCWNSCIQSCKDNCEWECSTSCGSGCMQGCMSGCKDQCTSCENVCTSASGAKTACQNGCVASCMHGCDKNCITNSCTAMCGSEGTNACDANCRMTCMSASCTAQCSEQCASHCTSCVNGCDMACGACSSLCSTGCEAACNITCSAHCQHSCNLNCVKSCTEACSGCSSLCTSCVGMCIGECSVKCTNNCSLCANNCGHWCDTKCSQNCFANCDNSCMQACTNSCIGSVTSDTKQPLPGPERPPTAHGYKTPHPSNREEERESFKILHDIDQITTDRIIREWKERLKKKSPYSNIPDTKICIKVKSNDNVNVIFTDCDPVPYNVYYSTVTGGVFNIDEKTGSILINHKALEEWAKSGYTKVVKNVGQKDGEDVSIIAVVLHCKDTNLTVDDVSYMRPLGYDFYKPYHVRNGDIICILQYLINYMEYDKNKHPDDQHITYPNRP